MMIDEALICTGALTAWRDQTRRIGLNDFAMALPCAESDMVPLGEFIRATERQAAESRCFTLGWTIGEAEDLRVFGQLGIPVLASSTLGVALKRLAGYFALLQDATELTVRHEDGACIVSYRILDPDIWPRHQDALFTLSLICQLIRSTGTTLAGKLEILLETGDATLVADLSRRTGLSCAGGHEANMLRFPEAMLNMPLRRNEGCGVPDCSGLNRSVAQRRRSTGIALRVRSLIYQHLGIRTIDQERIATQLGMSSRTLRRRLADVNLSFQQIVDDCRMRQAAHEFCQRGHVSIAQTALRLGYSEHSTFTRAFSRWSGMPPQQYIRAAAGGRRFAADAALAS